MSQTATGSAAKSNVTSETLESPRRRTLHHLRNHAPQYFKTSLGVAVLGYVIVLLLDAFVWPVSSAAVVAGSLTTLQAPIDGVVDLRGTQLGMRLRAQSAVVAIENRWADDSLVRNLRNRLAVTEAELASRGPTKEALEAFKDQLGRGATSYQTQRMNQLGSLRSESEAKVQAQQVQFDLARGRYRRVAALLQEGLVSQEDAASAERDQKVREQELEAARQALRALQTQRRAAQVGVNIDANGMGADRPYSGQRLDEVTLELLRLQQRIETDTRVRDALILQLASAEERARELSFATLTVDRAVRVWKVFASSRSYVTRGQPVLSVLNCDAGLVVAAVKERVFIKLKVGGRAIFKVNGQALRGTILRLDGLTRANENDEIVAPGLVTQRDPIPLSADPYRVTIDVPALTQPPFDDCTVGRTGDVHFESD